MSKWLDTSAALDGHLSAMIGIPALIEFENQGNQNPIVGQLYLRATNLQGSTVIDTTGDTTIGTELTIGVYQIDIYSESGKGKNESMVMADLLADRFKIDTTIDYNSAEVRVVEANRGTSFNNPDGWYQSIVEIVYESRNLRR